MNITNLSLNHIASGILSSLISILSVSALFASLEPGSAGGERGEDLFARSRREMVDKQLSRRGIKDARVLEAMLSVPRHLFVPEKHRRAAYEDRPLPIGQDQTISQPYIVALMTQVAELKGDERVLEVGTGSGYQAAVLSVLALEVYTIEIVPALAERARETLARLGYRNVWIKLGDGFFGWEEKAPFDAILVTASADKIPDPLWQQLREKGRLIMPLAEEGKNQRLIRVRKVDGKRQIEDITGVVFVPMSGAVEAR